MSLPVNISPVVTPYCEHSYHFNDHVEGLLQEYNDAGWDVVVVRVGPHQTDDMHEGCDVLLQLVVVQLFYVLEHVLERPKMQVNVLGLSECCNICKQFQCCSSPAE